MSIRYLIYNLIKTDYSKLNSYIKTLALTERRSIFFIWIDLIINLFVRKTRFLDYFYFRFFDKSTNKATHTNDWDMHKFHKKYNGADSIILRNKILFRKRFSSYFNYPYIAIENEREVHDIITWISHNSYNKIVIKQPLGTVGKGVKILDITHLEEGHLLIDSKPPIVYLNSLIKDNYTLFEPFIQQHESLSSINPNSINTIRIVTFVTKKKEVQIWAALLRMGVNNAVDNFDAGGISANIDIDTGLVIGMAISKDPFEVVKFVNHPITGNRIKGLQIPYWTEIISLVNRAALELETVRTVGWDVAITVNGPTLIEGNDNWDKTHFELTSGIGLKERINLLLSDDTI